MQIIGFNFTKIKAERSNEFPRGTSTKMNIEFLNIKKEDNSVFNGKDTISISFQYVLDYFASDKKKEESQANISLEGMIVLSAEKEESKEILHEWKKKKLAKQFKLFIFNFILRKCSAKALLLQEELNLPSHIPMPQIKPEQAE